MIYPVTLHIAKARDGRKILYDVNVKINEGVATDQNSTSLRAKKQARQDVRITKPSDGRVPQVKPVVKQKNSDRDSDGRQLSEGQWEYFKDSVVRDADENLLVMYHGTPNVVFTEFHSGTYFTQNPEYAALYQDPGASMLRVKRNAGISTISVVRLSWTLTVLAGTRFRRFPIIKAPLVKLNR